MQSLHGAFFVEGENYELDWKTVVRGIDNTENNKESYEETSQSRTRYSGRLGLG